jgi:hypothetical protein
MRLGPVPVFIIMFGACTLVEAFVRVFTGSWVLSGITSFACLAILYKLFDAWRTAAQVKDDQLANKISAVLEAETVTATSLYYYFDRSS